MEGELEESVWSKYPEELHMAILKRLPWMDKLRMRRVCVLWNSILRDPSLLKGSRSTRASSPFFCVRPLDRGGEFQLYSPLGKNWQTFTSSPNFKVIGAAAGLLLMQGEIDGKRTLILLNPLNRSQREIPLPVELQNVAVPQSYIFSMTSDSDTDTPRILAGMWQLLDDDIVRHPHFRHWHRWRFYIYTLDTNSWKLVADLCLRDEGNSLSTLREQLPSVTIVGTDLYLLSTFHGTSSHLYRIKATNQPSRCTNLGLEQDLVIGGDSGAQLPPSSSYVDSTLFGIDGRLILILRQSFRIGEGDSFMSNFWELSMYEFDFLSSEWKVGLNMPPELARSRSFVTFDVGAGFVCFHNDKFTGMCNIISSTWTMLPPPSVRSRPMHAPVRKTKIYVFEPRLDIIL